MFQRCASLAMISLVTSLRGGYFQASCVGSRRFVRASDTDSFLPESQLMAVTVLSSSLCAVQCYRHRLCTAFSREKSAGQCRMFSSYRTQSAENIQMPGVEYFTLQSLCGPSDVFLPMKYSRNDVIYTSEVTCGEMKVFEGTGETMFCTPPSSSWTTATAYCREKTNPYRIDGTFFRALDANLTIVGKPVGDSFDVTTSDILDNYNLKITVDVSRGVVVRTYQINRTFTSDKKPLLSLFPFARNEVFIMQIVNRNTDFECTINGTLLFRFEHVLPRDSMTNIRIFRNVDLLKIFTK